MSSTMMHPVDKVDADRASSEIAERDRITAKIAPGRVPHAKPVPSEFAPPADGARRIAAAPGTYRLNVKPLIVLASSILLWAAIIGALKIAGIL